MPLNEFRRRSNPLGAILFDLMHVNGVAFTPAGKLVRTLPGLHSVDVETMMVPGHAVK